MQLAALAAHGIGGAGLIAGNKARLAGRRRARANTGVKEERTPNKGNPMNTESTIPSTPSRPDPVKPDEVDPETGTDPEGNPVENPSG